MGERQARQERRRAREFEAFVAGAAGRLLHAATLLTGEPSSAAPAAEQLLVTALARTYADWGRLRGEDPYDRTRQELAARFAHTAWHYRRPRGGLLGRLPPQERLVLVLRLYEGVAEEQTAAALGLPVERVRALCRRGVAALLSRAPEEGVVRGGAAGAGPGAASRAGPGTPSGTASGAASRAGPGTPSGTASGAASRAAPGAPSGTAPGSVAAARERAERARAAPTPPGAPGAEPGMGGAA